MKKVLSLVLVIAMVLSSFSFAFAGTFGDIADTDYAKAIETLTALGVVTGYEDGTFRPEKVVTRAEMAKLMVELLGYGSLVSGSKSNFTDTQGHWADAYIGLAAGRGIVVGTGAGKFDPERTVSYDEVLTMLVRGLGYTDSSNELKNMTWPTNFKVKAAELNITKNVDINSTGADRGGVAQAMFNSLEQQLVKINTDGDVVREYKSVGDNDKVPVKLVSRVAAPKTIVVDFKHIDADSKDYAGNNVDLTPYLFQTVEVYFNRNNDKEAVYVGDVESVTYTETVEEATKTTVNSKDVYKLEVGDYTFDVTGAGSNVSYNGVSARLSDFTNYANDLEDAKVTVVFADKEKRVKDDAEVSGIVIEKANSFVQIEEVYKADATVIDEIYLPVKNKKVDEKNLIVTGDAKELSEIKVDDIVSVYAPYDKDATVKATDSLKLAVSRKTVEGKVTGLAKDAYYIDRTKYELNDGLNMDVLEVGDEGTFYLDDNGKVIAFTGESEGSKTYAVIDEVYAGKFELNSDKTKATITTAPKVKLATAGDEKVTYEFDLELKKVGTNWVVDGKLSSLFSIPTQPADTAYAEARVVYTGTKGTLVSYSLDSKDKTINTIEAAGRAITNLKTDSKSFVLASNAVIFDDEGNVISESKLGNEVTGQAVYKNGKIVALYATNISDQGTYYYAYINSTYADTDSDGDKVQRVNAYIQGKKNENLFTTKKNTVDDTKKGLYVLDLNKDDVVQNGEISFAGIGKEFKNSDIAGANVVTVTAINTGTGKVTVKDAAGVETSFFFDQGAATIIKVKKNNDIEVVNKVGGLNEGDKIEAFYNVTGKATAPATGYTFSTDTVGFIIVFEK